MKLFSKFFVVVLAASLFSVSTNSLDAFTELNPITPSSNGGSSHYLITGEGTNADCNQKGDAIARDFCVITGATSVNTPADVVSGGTFYIEGNLNTRVREGISSNVDRPYTVYATFQGTSINVGKYLYGITPSSGGNITGPYRIGPFVAPLTTGKYKVSLDFVTLSPGTQFTEYLRGYHEVNVVAPTFNNDLLRVTAQTSPMCGGMINLSWDKSTASNSNNAVGYSVYRFSKDPYAGEPYEYSVIKIRNINTTTYIDSGLQPKARYWYFVFPATADELAQGSVNVAATLFAQGQAPARGYTNLNAMFRNFGTPIPLIDLSTTLASPTCPPVVQAPDLTAETPTALVGARVPGTTITIKGFVKNNDVVHVILLFNNLFQISPDNFKTPENVAVLSPQRKGRVFINKAIHALSGISKNERREVPSLSYTPTREGIYFIRLCADLPDYDFGSVPESNEGNNCSDGLRIEVTKEPEVARPDLTVLAAPVVSGSVLATGGFDTTKPLTLNGAITNQSSVPIARAFFNLYQYSLDRVHYEDFTIKSLPQLKAFTTENLSPYTWNPTVGDTKTYYIRLCADMSGLSRGLVGAVVIESNENNNCSGDAVVSLGVPPPVVSPTLELKVRKEGAALGDARYSVTIPENSKAVLSWESSNTLGGNSCDALGSWSGKKTNVSTGDSIGPLVKGSYKYQVRCGSAIPGDMAMVTSNEVTVEVTACTVNCDGGQTFVPPGTPDRPVTPPVTPPLTPATPPPPFSPSTYSCAPSKTAVKVGESVTWTVRGGGTTFIWTGSNITGKTGNPISVAYPGLSTKTAEVLVDNRWRVVCSPNVTVTIDPTFREI